MMDGKRITIIIGGGIAAYKALELIRRLKDRGAEVRGVLTKGGSEFITALSVASLTGEKCYTDLFSLTDEAEMGHIRLSREADLLLVAPATADLMAKMANGLANDLASTILLATDKPVMVAPAMNVEMWAHKATQRNIKTLTQDGIHFVGPDEGMMACGEVGLGRLSDVDNMVEAVEAFFAKKPDRSAPLPLAGKRALVTAGPTQEAIDPVRYIANHSSGKQGYAIAGTLAALGADVTLVSGPTNLAVPSGVHRMDVTSAAQMLDAVRSALPADIAVMVAAVADWRLVDVPVEKIKKTKDGIPALKFMENADILADVSSLKKDRPALVVGFAAETEDVVANATAKRDRKGCDWIVANDVSAETGIMGGDSNEVTVITDQGAELWDKADKQAVAEKLAAKIADHFKG